MRNRYCSLHVKSLIKVSIRLLILLLLHASPITILDSNAAYAASIGMAPPLTHPTSGISLSDFANLIAAFSAVTAIFIGIGTYRAQNQQAMRLLGLQILRDFEERFFSAEDMLRLRRSVSRHYQTHHRQDHAPESWRLADHLDGICFYVNRGYIEPGAVWVRFYFWLDKYFYLLQPYIEDMKQAENVDYYAEIAEAHEKLTRFGKNSYCLPSASFRLSPEKIQEFLQDEIRETTSALNQLQATTRNNQYSPQFRWNRSPNKRTRKVGKN